MRHLLQPQQTVLAQWHALVSDAVIQSGYRVDESICHYLIITLDHFTTDQQLTSVVLAVDFLHALEAFGRQGNELLRQVGDRCLLIAGLFPEYAYKKKVTANYFITLGRQAYDTLANFPIQRAYDSELFHKLSEEFVHLTNVLHTMRALHAVVH